MTTDPVCGMKVSVENPPAKTEYRDRYYYFCANVCKDAFEQDPAHYASSHPGLQPPVDKKDNGG